MIKNYAIAEHYDVFETLAEAKAVAKKNKNSEREISMQIWEDQDDGVPLYEIYADGTVYNCTNADGYIPDNIFEMRDQFINELTK